MKGSKFSAGLQPDNFCMVQRSLRVSGYQIRFSTKQSFRRLTMRLRAT